MANIKSERPNAKLASELTGVSDVQLLIVSNTTDMEKIDELIRINQLFPTNRVQAEAYINSKYGCLGLLGMKDVQMIEELLGKYDMQGRYQYTKSHGMVRFLSTAYLEEALRKEYKL